MEIRIAYTTNGYDSWLSKIFDSKAKAMSYREKYNKGLEEGEEFVYVHGPYIVE